MTLHAIVAALGGALYAGGARANVPAPGHSRSDRSVSLLLSGDRLVIHSFGAASWRAVRDHLHAAGLIDRDGRPAAGPEAGTGGGVGTGVPDPRPDRATRLAAARRLWAEAGPLTPASLSRRHLVLRAIRTDLAALAGLRHHGAPVRRRSGDPAGRPGGGRLCLWRRDARRGDGALPGRPGRGGGCGPGGRGAPRGGRRRRDRAGPRRRRPGPGDRRPGPGGSRAGADRPGRAGGHHRGAVPGGAPGPEGGGLGPGGAGGRARGGGRAGGRGPGAGGPGSVRRAECDGARGRDGRLQSRPARPADGGGDARVDPGARRRSADGPDRADRAAVRPRRRPRPCPAVGVRPRGVGRGLQPEGRPGHRGPGRRGA